jgi:hypothetical protein
MPNKEDIKIPLGSYAFKIKECKKDTSKSSGNPMLVVKAEVVNEGPMIVDGETVDINGLEGTKYISLTEKSIKTLNDFRESCGLEGKVGPADLSNVEPGHFEGRTFTALANTKEEDMVDRDTKQPVINKLTGKPIKSSRFEIGRILTANN